MFRIRPFLAAAVAIAAMACGDSTIEIPRPVTASVRLTPGDKSLDVGEQVNYTAIALTEDGAELPGRVVTWASSNSNIASITESGVLTANAAGQAKISAEVDGRSATATIIVTATEQPQDSTKVVRVALTPAAAVVEIGETKRYTAVGLNAAGRIVPGKTATWVADNPNAATIDATGALLGVGAGYLAVTAT
ncbi:MAG TPA: Ig-like domain-containing protein, partial [Gemmatimonadaceae bacterium]